MGEVRRATIRKRGGGLFLHAQCRTTMLLWKPVPRGSLCYWHSGSDGGRPAARFAGVSQPVVGPKRFPNRLLTGDVARLTTSGGGKWSSHFVRESAPPQIVALGLGTIAIRTFQASLIGASEQSSIFIFILCDFGIGCSVHQALTFPSSCAILPTVASSRVVFPTLLVPKD